jgi:hypothetical protein
MMSGAASRTSAEASNTDSETTRTSEPLRDAEEKIVELPIATTATNLGNAKMTIILLKAWSNHRTQDTENLKTPIRAHVSHLAKLTQLIAWHSEQLL